MKQTFLRLSPSRKRAFTAALSVAGILLSTTPATYAVNAAWNTDASSGNFNTAQWSNAGTPIAGGTYTVLSGDALVFGTSTTTTLNNDLSGALYAGLTFNSGASAFTIGGNSFTLTGNVVNSSTSTQTINNAITLSGARTFTATSGQLVFGGNITGSSGTWTFNSTNKITLGGTNNVTMAANSGGFIVNSGAGGVDITGSTTINGAAGNTQSGYMNVAGTVTVTIKSGGSLTITPTTNANFPGGIVGQNAAGTSTVSVESGGSLTYGGNQGLAFGNNRTDAIGVLEVSGTATLNAGSTTATDSRSYVSLGRDSGTGTVNLNTGGVLATDRNFIRDGSGAADTTGAGNFNFKGGTLKALANQTDWLNSSTKNTNQLALSSVTTTSAASTIDSNGFTVAINNNISGAGGFNIISSSGNGTVTFGGTNTYTGDTKVLSGTLTLGSSSATAAFLADTTSLYLTTGSLLNLSFTSNSVMESIAGLYIDGVQQAAGTWGALGSGADNTSALITGTGFLNVTSAIPEPSTYAALAGVLTLGAAVLRRRIRRSAAPAV